MWIPSLQELVWFTPELTLVGTMVMVLIVPLIAGRSAYTSALITLLGVALTTLLTVRMAGEVAHGGVSGLAPAEASGMLLVDNLSIFFKLILMLFMACVIGLWWVGSAATEHDAPEFFTLMLGSALGMALMVSTTNMLMMAIAIELTSLPSYAMVGFDKRNRLGAEASLKYVIFGGVSAAIMLFGGSILYGLYGSLDLSVIASGIYTSLLRGTDTAMVVVASICMLGGIAFKISAVPFHFWCPDAFQGARIEVTTWLSVVSKAAGLLLLARIVHVLGTSSNADPLTVLSPVAWVLGLMAAVTCTWGNFAAYQQTSVKRMLAYSSIAHAGYMLMAVAIIGKDPSSVSALLLYILIYLFMNLGAFGVTAMVIWQTGSDSIDSFTGLIRRAPWLAVPMLCCLISLVGLPPFAGFIGKYWVLSALIEQGSAASWLYVILAVVAVFNTLFSLYYYMRIVVRMMLKDDGQAEWSPPFAGLVLVNGSAALLVAMLILAGPIKAGTDRYAGKLYRSPMSTSSVEHASAVAPLRP